MFIFFSKFLPVFIYPLGIALLLNFLAVFLVGRRGWARLVLIAALVILWLSSTRVFAMGLARSLEQQYLPPVEWPAADAIVVLGGGTDPALSPRPLVEVGEAGDRVVLGAWLYHQNKADKLVLTGGTVPWLSPERIPPGAENMAVLMAMLGVPEESLLLEPQSRNTYENAVFTRELLTESGVETILLVTSATHMPRSVRLFEAQGFQVIPAPTDFQAPDAEWAHLWTPDLGVQLLNWLPDAWSLYMTQVALKEYVGLLVYGLQGWL